MIDKLKRKFVILATVSMFVLMTLLILVMNAVNYYGILSESDGVLELIAGRDERFFDGGPGGNLKDGMKKFEGVDPGERGGFPGGKGDDGPPPLPRGMSREVPYESRFFVVNVSKEGEVVQSDMSRIVSVDEDGAAEFAERVMGTSRLKGFVENFRYLKQGDGEVTKIVFLDCGRKLDSFRLFMGISIVTGLFGCLAVFVAFLLTAGRIVAPIAESYEKQKRFISDAGHEIKTPLTIINANVDLLELDGESEELTEIRQQTSRLTDLTNNLITLSKMEEAATEIRRVDFSLSDLASDMVNSFRAPAEAAGLTFAADIAPDVMMNGDCDGVSRLLSVLFENALKYSPPESRVDIKIEEQRKNVSISVMNATRDLIEEKELAHVFDRFYRTDLSRNSETGGHGIGLSMAKAIAQAHKGTIAAFTKTGHDFGVTVVLPK